jgi:hypothetical protein
VGQRGVAGAEIVEGDGHARLAEALKIAFHHIDIAAEEDGFGDFQLDPARFDIGMGEAGEDDGE